MDTAGRDASREAPAHDPAAHEPAVDDEPRGARGEFLSVAQTRALGRRNTVLDPHSVLVSRFAVVGDGNTFYPGTVLEADERSELVVGHGNVFYPGCFLRAQDGGRLVVGACGEYGPGGVQVLAGEGTTILVGDEVRLMNGPQLVGATHVGDGGQVIGPIRVQSVRLDGGGSHREEDVDARAGVLKGFGLARGLHVGVGEVVNGVGDFAAAPVERQRAYHPA
ncbi:hypothetical protein [Cellulomonas fimi]|uniref:Uncharacterized protein n=1 Tax=Cellulomonas fimi (strain ATCC 484 / DSM 20113 / JCM 1341 / CCUG 24087 / LMG 16345 / NBRC 15513 / NCIMB 8980 / NCTC 7547 / NRS-133) TaxID=590998 RepID=F4GZV7_CELFA|nr:hypothetical protein [Cellulomonas fimi]AEE47273.1 hypothetical protein Celf_3159 [Cellulomonas fimi ATCC 484]NNH06987.1 hypothetical protein [Cellulomonas fimi]VEH35779.1 Uncharacterised protein [Cellulomonas fimi]